MKLLAFNGKLISVNEVLDGKGTKIFEIEINNKRYKFSKQLRYESLDELANLQGKLIKLEGRLEENSKNISNVIEFWVKLF